MRPNRFLKEVSVSFALKIAGKALGYALTFLITSWYGVGTMGAFSISVTIFLILSSVGKLGLDIAFLRFVSEFSTLDGRDGVKALYGRIIRITLPLCLVLSALVFLLSEYIAENVFFEPGLSIYLKIISAAFIPFVIASINAEGLRALRRITEYNVLMEFSVPLFTVLLIGVASAASFGGGGPVTVLAYSVSVVIVYMTSQYLWARGCRSAVYPSVEGRKPRDISALDMLGVSVPVLISNLMFLVIGWAGLLMLGMLRSFEEVGVYSVALKMAMLTSIPLFAVNTSTASRFAQCYAKGEMGKLRATVIHSARLVFWMSLPVLLVFFIFPGFVLGVFGEEFRIGAAALIMISIGEFLNASSGSAGLVLQMTGREKIFRNIIIAATAINICLNIILIPRYGINGAAASSMISTSFWNIASVLYIKWRFGFSTFYFPGMKILRHEGAVLHD